MNTEMQYFETDDLPFAAFLKTTGKLRFYRCESRAGNRIAFLFHEDETGKGDQLNEEFLSGAEVPAASFYEAIRTLRRLMSTKQTNRSNHEYHESHR